MPTWPPNPQEHAHREELNPQDPRAKQQLAPPSGPREERAPHRPHLCVFLIRYNEHWGDQTRLGLVGGASNYLLKKQLPQQIISMYQ